jgi:hypothetical protein
MQTIKDFNMKKKEKRLIHFFVSVPEQKRRCDTDICRLCKQK